MNHHPFEPNGEVIRYPFQLRRMEVQDVYKLGLMNVDHYIENFELWFYLLYLVNHPEWQFVLLDPRDATKVVGYLLARPEGGTPGKKLDHAHIAAVAVAAEYRGLGGGQLLIDHLYHLREHESEPYIDLYVRRSNTKAIQFYKRLGYDVYKIMTAYYQDAEDGLDMRIYFPGEEHPDPLPESAYNCHESE